MKRGIVEAPNIEVDLNSRSIERGRFECSTDSKRSI
uniref:Uncharacterized protein n=1 Tax=Nelumbo nucifera TaxID=4432 RepID=A0A822ZX70_NELNU|nr:TPA_asm: hypothetical protein HUJ06_016445 [Nelumbo nucifera]